ncbi:hypothetical protein ACJRO7_022336 [Eucalyptus globulus]|uniref:Uncharacterized protein n=1 Tax=Eucalyptus globulus TaxID=34317 RepID=A0ABD3K0N8_EUCGL
MVAKAGGFFFPGLLLVALLLWSEVDSAKGRILWPRKWEKKGDYVKSSGGTGGFSPGMGHRHILLSKTDSESTDPGHSPGVGHITSERKDQWSTEPGHNPGAGHSTGPGGQDPNP